MKTTFNLPDDLVRRLKLRAVRDRRKLKDVAAEFLQAGLSARAPVQRERPAVVAKDKKTGLPVIRCRHAAPRGQELTPDWVAELLNAQEAEWARVSG